LGRARPFFQDSLYYLHADHPSAPLRAGLGSASLTTDANGNKFSEQRYYPYGDTRSGASPTDRQFTGQRHEASLGLYDYGARFYSPYLGRFLSADTLVPNAANPQDLNRYSYTRNNPLKYTDPTGHICVPCVIAVGIIVLKAVDYGWTAYDTAQSIGVLNDPNASTLDRRMAELNIALAVVTELGEPDDALPVSIPADDVVRRGAVKAAREALEAGDEAALKKLPEWLQPIVRGIVKEGQVLDALGRVKNTRTIQGLVGREVVDTVPDFIDDAGKIVGEVKDVAGLGWEKQIQAQYDWATKNGYTYQLIIRRGTELQGELAELVKRKIINVKYIEDVLP
jgi:RHS repeat-associated protein